MTYHTSALALEKLHLPNQQVLFSGVKVHLMHSTENLEKESRCIKLLQLQINPIQSHHSRVNQVKTNYKLH